LPKGIDPVIYWLQDVTSEFLYLFPNVNAV